MVKWIITALVVLPVLEIAVFVLIAAVIGLGWALGLLLATSAAGFLVLRHAGRGRLARFRVAVADSDVTEFEANTSGMLTIFAGLLLLLPGFITDLAGALLLIGPVRRRCGEAFRRAVHGRGRNSVVDLAPGEWSQVPDRDSNDERDRR